MPFTFYLSSENQLSIQDVEVLQNAARANDTGNIIIGDRQLSVRYQSAMDAFIVNPVQGGCIQVLIILLWMMFSVWLTLLRVG